MRSPDLKVIIMNETYALKDLLKFLKGQHKSDFQGIRVLLEIYDGGLVADERKYFVIISGLRAMGLYEVNYEKPTLEDILKEDEKEIEFKKNDVPDEIHWKKGSSTVGINTFRCKILNGTIEFWKILN